MTESWVSRGSCRPGPGCLGTPGLGCKARAGLTLPQPSISCCDFGDQTVFVGFPLLDSGDRGRQAARGSGWELASAPSWPPHLSASHPVTAKPADRGGNRKRRGLGQLSTWGRVRWRRMAAPADPTASEEGRGKSVGIPLSTGYLEKQNIINIPILSLKKKKVF